MSTEQSRHGWRIAGFFVSVLLFLTLGIYNETVWYLGSLWKPTDGQYAHGYLTLAISIYLVMRNRQTLSALTPRPNYWALLAVMIASLLWTLAALGDVQMLQPVALLLLLLAITWSVLGNHVAWKLLFPILFLGFAIPVWSPLLPFLQDLTADVIFRGIRVLGIPGFRQDNTIVLPAGTLSITAACGGLNYLLAALTLGMLYAYLNYETFRTRLVVVLIAAGAAVLANILRVFIVVYLAYATEMHHPLVSDHLNLGWYLFGVLVFVLLILDVRFHQSHQPDIGKQKVVESDMPDYYGQGNLKRIMPLLVVALLISAGPAVVYMVKSKSSEMNRAVKLELPTGVGGWIGPVDSNDDWMPEYPGAIIRKQAYSKGSDSVSLFIGYYPVQKQGEELINDLNRIANREVWHSVSPRGRLRKAGDLRVLEQMLKKDNGEQRLVWYWYYVSGQYTTNDYQAKVLQVIGLVTGESQASVIAVAVNLGGDSDSARKVLDEFLSAMEVALVALVQGKPN